MNVQIRHLIYLHPASVYLYILPSVQNMPTQPQSFVVSRALALYSQITFPTKAIYLHHSTLSHSSSFLRSILDGSHLRHRSQSLRVCSPAVSPLNCTSSHHWMNVIQYNRIRCYMTLRGRDDALLLGKTQLPCRCACLINTAVKGREISHVCICIPHSCISSKYITFYHTQKFP